jgi:predicted thioredoxin/glutaredoxin
LNEREENFEDIEVHVSDGIDMGTIQNTIKGIVGKEIFEEEKVENVIVKGVEASERTFLNKKNERDVLERISNMNLTTEEVTKLRK